MAPLNSVFVVPEVLEVHVIPSGEVSMVPEGPTVTKDGVSSVVNPLPVSY